jgi:hypothetical protein
VGRAVVEHDGPFRFAEATFDGGDFHQSDRKADFEIVRIDSPSRLPPG